MSILDKQTFLGLDDLIESYRKTKRNLVYQLSKNARDEGWLIDDDTTHKELCDRDSFLKEELMRVDEVLDELSSNILVTIWVFGEKEVY